MRIAQSTRGALQELLFLTVIALCVAAVFLWHLGQPPMLFWDENYHLASANKYLSGVMFMEPHPPLGKLLIAASEWLLGDNAHMPRDMFLITAHVKGVPEEYSFFPGRLPSALCAALGAFVFYFLVRELTHYPAVALAFTSIYVFDNALVVQSRAAMLEGIQIFFVLLALWWGVRAFRETGRLKLRYYAILGVFVGLAVATKLNALVLLLLFPVAWGYEHREFAPCLLRFPPRLPGVLVRSGVLKGGIFGFFIMAVIAGAYYIHTGLGAYVVADNNYQASPQYLALLKNGESTWNPRHFPLMLRDNLDFIAHYNNGVPSFKPYAEEEAGSFPLRWPLGGKAISYRWDHGDNLTKYIYLVCNPVGWGVGLVGLFLGMVFGTGRALREFKPHDTRLFGYMVLFLSLWMSYMGSMLHLKRVMYLYHYLMPLMFSWVLAALCFCYIFREALQHRRRWVMVALVLLVLLNVSSFAYFAPFTYHLPITFQECQNRNWLPLLWDIHCVQ